MITPGVPRRIDPDAEVQRLAEERKRATEAAQPHCRFCDATAPVPLMHSPLGWQCLDGIDCYGRQNAEPEPETAACKCPPECQCRSGS